MKTIRFQLFHRTVQFAAIISAICCIGCADLDDVLKAIKEPPEEAGGFITDMPIGEIEVLLAESDPVQVTVEINGWLPDLCSSHRETHQMRDGNTIFIKITITRSTGFCATAAPSYQERVFIGALPPGDYTVIVNDVEQQFRID